MVVVASAATSAASSTSSSTPSSTGIPSNIEFLSDDHPFLD